jgi:hypothetical protein
LHGKFSREKETLITMKKFLLLASTLCLIAAPIVGADPSAAQSRGGLSIPPAPRTPTVVPNAPVSQPMTVTAPSDQIVVDKAQRPMTAKDEKQQKFIDYIDLQPGQESLPLTITFTNGSGGTPQYKWLRVSIGGRPYLTEADFAKNTTMNVNLSGDIGNGATQIMVLGSGDRGATLDWVVTTPKPVITSTKPPEGNIGENINIIGKNFSTTPTANQITFGDQNLKADIVSATKTNILCRIPEKLKPGHAAVNVTVLGQKGKSITIKVKGRVPAELTDLVGQGFSWSGDVGSVPPGAGITIRGTNFGDKNSKVKVFFGDYEASVGSHTDTEISTTVPAGLDAVNPNWGIPVYITVDDVKSKNYININVQNRVW